MLVSRGYLTNSISNSYIYYLNYFLNFDIISEHDT